jgi:PAS domain S-box-containing protein
MTEACRTISRGSPKVKAATKEALLDRLQESQQRQREVTALLKGSRAVLKYRNFQDAARAIFDSCKELIGATSGYVALLDKDAAENEVLFLDAGGLPCTVDPRLPMPIRGLRGKAYRSGQAVYHNDFSHSGWVRFLPAGHVRLENVLFAPLVIGEKVLGLLGVANKPGGFSDDDARMASAFGELAAIALQNSRTLQSLEHSEERFRSLAQSASDGIICANSSGQIVYWNQAAETMFGYPAEQIIGQPLSAIMPQRVRNAHQRGLKRAVSTGNSGIVGKTVEVVGLRSDGSEFPIEFSLASWKTAEGLFFTGILRDVAARKRAEEEIESLSRFPSENPYPVMRVAADGTLLYANAAAKPLLSEIGCGLGGVLSGECRELSENALGSDSSRRIDVAHDGRVFSLVVVPVSSAGYVNWYGSDVTEARRAEEALQEAKDLLEIEIEQRTAELRNKEESLAEAQRIAHLGNWDWNIPTNALLWSDEVYRIFGLQPGEFAATYDAFLKYVHPDDRAQVEEAVRRALAKPGTQYSIDHRVIRPDGSECIVHERGEVMFDRQAKPVRMIGTVHDITDRKKLEREILRISTDEQRRIGQELHDGLGQELTGLSYLAKNLHQRLRNKNLPEAQTAAELARSIPRALGQLQTIVKGLLPLEIDAEDLLPALYGLAAHVEERTGVSCRFRSDRRGRVNADNTAIQLYRIAQEAINNAVKHAHAQHIDMALTSRRNHLRLEVRDDGVGVGPDVGKASGSGLRIMRYRASAIGGTLDIRKRSSGGTIVTCLLPREKSDDRTYQRQEA